MGNSCRWFVYSNSRIVYKALNEFLKARHPMRHGFVNINKKIKRTKRNLYFFTHIHFKKHIITSKLISRTTFFTHSFLISLVIMNFFLFCAENEAINYVKDGKRTVFYRRYNFIFRCIDQNCREN